MKHYKDEITAQTSSRELSKIAKERVKELQKKEGKFKLTGNKGMIFTFSSEEKRDSFKKDFPQYFE